MMSRCPISVLRGTFRLSSSSSLCTRFPSNCSTRSAARHSSENLWWGRRNQSKTKGVKRFHSSNSGSPKKNVTASSNTTTKRSSSKSSSSSSSSSFVWQAATFVVVGATFVGVTNYLNGPSFRNGGDDDDDGDNQRKKGPAPPQAEITSRAYMDISIENRPPQRIVLGLYGNVVPKTVQNLYVP